jgi:flagellar hook-basal body complex protein FliE
MSIAGISGIGGISPSALIQQVQSAATSNGAGATDGAEGAGFGEWLGNALDTVSASQTKADSLAVQAATGDLSAIHDFTIASTEAQLLTQLTVEVRNRAIEAFNDIMRMQV